MKCILCSKEGSFPAELSKNARGVVYTTYQCPDCSVFFSDPMKPMSSEEYQGGPFEGYYADRWEFRKALDLLAGYKTMLEVGCGDGRFLGLARKKGFEVVGLDLNKDAVRVAKERCGSDRVYDWTISRFMEAFPQEKFDVVCAFHLVEHLEDPLGFARAAVSIMKKDGYFVAAVPSQKRQSLFYAEREDWDRPPHHLTRWDEKSFTRLMDMSGFEVVEKINEPITLRSTVEALIKKVRFGLIRKIESDRSGKERRDSDRYGPAQGNIADTLAIAKRMLFYPAALIWLVVDRMRGLTGRNMLIIAKKKG